MIKTDLAGHPALRLLVRGLLESEAAEIETLLSHVERQKTAYAIPNLIIRHLNLVREREGDGVQAVVRHLDFHPAYALVHKAGRPCKQWHHSISGGWSVLEAHLKT